MKVLLQFDSSNKCILGSRKPLLKWLKMRLNSVVHSSTLLCPNGIGRSRGCVLLCNRMWLVEAEVACFCVRGCDWLNSLEKTLHYIMSALFLFTFWRPFLYVMIQDCLLSSYIVEDVYKYRTSSAANSWCSLTYTSTMPSNFALWLIMDCQNALQFWCG